MRRIGFLVNPVAGMGGSVGLKGTDGKVADAVLKGAVPRAGERARSTLSCLAGRHDLWFVTCSGSMGETVLKEAGIGKYEVLYHPAGESTAEDTRNAARTFAEAGVDLLLFCGGDGTARDIFDSIGSGVPVLGIPAGVKMYSAVFALDPGTAAEIIIREGELSLKDAEVMDVDEDAYRAGILSTRLYGFARVPCSEGKIQASKHVFEEADEGRARREIGRFISEVMLPGVLYILGAGTTVEAVADEIGVKKTLLGIDVIKNGNLIAADADETTLLSLCEEEEDIRIIVSPIGAQGFIFGRGNQQVSSHVVRKAGIDHVIVIATPQKLSGTPALFVDTGDPVLNGAFGNSVQVISGYRIAQRKKIYQSACQLEQG